MTGHAAFLLPDMGSGGAERLTVELANGFAERGAHVDCVLMAAQGEFLPLLDPRISVIDLTAPNLRNVPAALRRYLREAKPDTLLAAMWPLTSVAAIGTLGLSGRPRMVFSDHCSLREQYAGPLPRYLTMRATMPVTSYLADHVIAVSDGLANEVAKLAFLPRHKVQTIWNPVGTPLCSKAVKKVWGTAPGPRLLAVGRLKQQKNFPLLLRAFARFAAERKGTLAIVGEGEERPNLETLIAGLGMQERILLPGFTTTPGDWYAGADLFVLPSDYEGFGNVVVEALHAGLRIVATDCRHGPAEILGHGQWGALTPVGDEAALAAALAQALDAPHDPEAQKQRAAEFSVAAAVEAYWQAMFPQ